MEVSEQVAVLRAMDGCFAMLGAGSLDGVAGGPEARIDSIRAGAQYVGGIVGRGRLLHGHEPGVELLFVDFHAEVTH